MQYLLLSDGPDYHQAGRHMNINDRWYPMALTIIDHQAGRHEFQ